MEDKNRKRKEKKHLKKHKHKKPTKRSKNKNIGICYTMENKEEEKCIEICSSCKVFKGNKIKIDELYDILEKSYVPIKKNGRERNGLEMYEYYNSRAQKIKIHFDYEEYVDREMDEDDISDLRNRLHQYLATLFKSELKEWAITKDHRKVDKKFANGKKIVYLPRKKISFHFVLNGYKVSMTNLKLFVDHHLERFKENGFPGIDTAIYRDGINKFRLPYARKPFSKYDEKSLMKPVTHKSKEDFHRHLVSYIGGCESRILIIPKPKYELYPDDNEKAKVVLSAKRSVDEASQRIHDKINEYTILSTKIKPETGFTFYDVQEYECGKHHENNHNYISHDMKTNILTMRCHSKKCSHWNRILYRPRPPTDDFDSDFLLNIPIPNGKKDNYQEVKNYFEYYFVFIRDLNSYYRKYFTFNCKLQYYVMNMAQINIDGWKKDMYYKEKKEVLEQKDEEDNNEDEEEDKLVNFYKRYERDVNKHAYGRIVFSPYGVHERPSGNKEYNEFQGFVFETLLSFEEENNIPESAKKDCQFLINHIQNHVCGLHVAKQIKNVTERKKAMDMSDKLFDYLIQYIAHIIQHPQENPQIVLVFFSKVHGTGKSGLTKFIGNIIGNYLTYFGGYKQIFEKHSQSQRSKLINVVEESSKEKSKQYYDAVKDASQRDRAVINPKNKPQFDIDVFIRYIITTNYFNGVHFDVEDRRHVVFTFHKVKDTAHVQRFERVLKDKFVMFEFGKFLASRKIKFREVSDWFHARPLTPDYFLMRYADPIQQFLKDFIKLESIGQGVFDITNHSNHPNGKIVIKKPLYYEVYKNWCSNATITPLNKTEFTNCIKLTYSDYHEIKRGGIKGQTDGQTYHIDLPGILTFLEPLVEFKNKHVQLPYCRVNQNNNRNMYEYYPEQKNDEYEEDEGFYYEPDDVDLD